MTAQLVINQKPAEVLVPVDLLERAIKLLSGEGIALVTHEQKVAHYIAESDAARDLALTFPTTEE